MVFLIYLFVFVLFFKICSDLNAFNKIFSAAEGIFQSLLLLNMFPVYTNIKGISNAMVIFIEYSYMFLCNQQN